MYQFTGGIPGRRLTPTPILCQNINQSRIILIFFVWTSNNIGKYHSKYHGAKLGIPKIKNITAKVVVNNK
jgi:hypothetical protein